MSENVLLAPGRSCSGCTMCCKVPSVPELDKPAQVVCVHCALGQGCKIYASRPARCASFHCLYLTDANVPEHWRPDRSHMILEYQAAYERLVVFVDDAHADAWRETPYHGELRRWAASAYAMGGQVLIYARGETIGVLPHKDAPLGVVRPDQFIMTTQQPTPQGIIFDLAVVDPDDPRARRR